MFFGNGDGTFGDAQGYGGFAFNVTCVDVDNDGDMDVVATGFDGNELNIWPNDGSGTLTYAGGYPTLSEPMALGYGDIDGDGDGDVLIGYYSLGYVSILWNAGDGSFGTRTDCPVGPVSRAVALGDLDADGDLDAVVE